MEDALKNVEQTCRSTPPHRVRDDLARKRLFSGWWPQHGDAPKSTVFRRSVPIKASIFTHVRQE